MPASKPVKGSSSAAAGAAPDSRGVGVVLGGVVSWSNLTVPAGGSLALSFTATVNARGSYVNRAEVTAADQVYPDSQPDPTPDADRSVIWRPVAPSGGALRFVVGGRTVTAPYSRTLGGWVAPAGVLRAGSKVAVPAGARIVHGDALRLDWADVLGPEPGWVLVANLPYNIATPLVLDLLEGVPTIARMLVMVQHEVGERLAAGVGDEAYGAVSVKVAWWAEAKVVGKVPPTVFVPQPRVDSALVAVTRRPEAPVAIAPATYDDLFALVRKGFGQRRKMLRRALAGMVEPGVFTAAGVAPEARAEELDLDAWARLAVAWKQ